MYYTVIKHNGHLRTWGKCRKHEPQASVFYIYRVFSNDQSVLSQCNTRLRASSVALKYRFYTRKTIKHAFSMFYTAIKHGFLTNQSARRILSVFWAWIKLVLRGFWTASKIFHKKRVSWESKQTFKLWGENISIQEKQAMPYQYSLYKE